MAAVGGPLIAFVLVSIMLSMVIVFPTKLGSPDSLPPPEEDAFDAPIEDYTYVSRACPCYDWKGEYQVTRSLSNTFFSQVSSIPDPRGLNTWAWAWGQFIDHTIVRASDNVTAPRVNISLVPGPFSISMIPAESHEESPTCKRQKNNLSPFLDGSSVYSDYTDVQRALQLRVEGKCELAVDAHGFLPVVNGSFFCGDTRCSEHPVLSTLHTLFVREHNRWCNTLRLEKPTWTENQLYYKARSYVVTVIQAITYNEFLPAIFGSQAELLTTVPLKRQDANILREFSVVAYRFGHSMVNDVLGPWDLATLFFNPSFVLEHGLEAIIQAATSTAAQKVDGHVVDGLRNTLFGHEDLVVRNLVRARLEGLSTGQQMATCYDFSLQGAFPQSDALMLLLNQPLMEGSSLPRGIAIIVAEQFRRLRLYDPKFYDKRLENLGSRHYPELIGSTLSKVIERNTLLTNLKPNLFFL